VVSDFLLPMPSPAGDNTLLHSLRAVAAKHDVVAVHITDPRELELPSVGRVCVHDPETGEEFLVDTGHPAVREHYAQRLQAQQEELHQLLRAQGVQSLPVRTDQDYVAALKAYFRSRKRRKR
jgi:uncharacterized protein (DUF58 family)